MSNNITIPEDTLRESLQIISRCIHSRDNSLIQAEAEFHLKRLQSYLSTGIKAKFLEDYAPEGFDSGIAGPVIKAGEILDVVKLAEHDSMIVRCADGHTEWILDDAKTQLINEDEENEDH